MSEEISSQIGGEVDPPPTTHRDRPDPAWVRGRCPECGDDLVSHLYYMKGEGYIIAWECWSSREPSPSCTYKKVL